MQLRFQTFDGLELACETDGDEGNPTVILAHGSGQTRHSWQGTMRKLASAGYFVLNYDARGHGDSDWSPTEDYTLLAFASDLAAIRSTIPGPVAVVGASLGGISAFYMLGLLDGPKIEALVMVDVVPRVRSEGLRRVQRFMTDNLDGFANLEEAAAAVTAYNPGRKRSGDMQGLYKNLRRKADGRLYWHWDPAILFHGDDREAGREFDRMAKASHRVTCPTLVVRGSRSDIVDDEGVEEMIRLVPQTEVHNVAGVGHMVAGHGNDAFDAGILDFLGRCFAR